MKCSFYMVQEKLNDLILLDLKDKFRNKLKISCLNQKPFFNY